MAEEIPAQPIIEGYRKLVSELTEENLILKWQVSQKVDEVNQLIGVMEQMSEPPESETGTLSE